MRVQGARQVVLVDWASEPPLRTVIERVLGENNRTEGDVPEVTVVRVEGENDWVLTRAYNLGVRHAMFDYVFKVDCDYVVGERAIVRHPLTEDAGDVFFTGYYMNARDANEMHLNGALVVSQRRFWAVGGYDERVQSYGYDDEDLYKRLLHAGMKRLNVSYDQVRHIEHADKSRAQEGVKFPRVQIDMNSLLLEKIDRPWEKSDRASEYERVPGRADTVRAVYVPPTLESLVEKGVRDELWKLSVARRLRDEYRIPWGVISSMEVGEAEKLLENMNRRKVRAEYDEVRHTGLAVRFVLVHVQNGLGNRLRVLASGLSFADRTGREPIIVWEKDVHFRGFYSDIFNATQTKFAVLDTFQPKWPLAPHAEFDEAWKDIEFYNYLIKEDVGNEIVDDEKKNIYFKSSAIMNSRVTTWESENEQLRNLKVHGYITGMATRISNAGNFKNVGGVHIRNRSLEDDIIGVKDNHGLYDKDDAAEIEKWRATTKYTSFVDEMKALLKNGTVDKFFVATDAVDVLGTMEGLFPEGKILFITRDCDDRGGRCEQFAMADLLVLSRTKVLLGSTWSSFTEAAMRLGGPKALMAGKLRIVLLPFAGLQTVFTR